MAAFRPQSPPSMFPEPQGNLLTNMLTPQDRNRLLGMNFGMSGLATLADAAMPYSQRRGAAPYLMQAMRGYQGGMQDLTRNRMAQQQMGMQQERLGMQQDEASRRSTLFDRDIAAEDLAAGRAADSQAWATAQGGQMAGQDPAAYRASIYAQQEAERVRGQTLGDRDELREYKAELLVEERADKDRFERLKVELQKEATAATGGLTPDQVLTQTGKVRKEHGRHRDKHADARAAYQRVKGAEDTAIGDLSMIVSYMKMIDPGSVVRKAEVDVVSQTASIPDSVWTMYLAATKGARLNPNQRQQILSQSDILYAKSSEAMAGIDQAFRDLADELGLKKDAVVVQFPEPNMLQPAPGGGMGTIPQPAGISDEDAGLWDAYSDTDRQRLIDLMYSE